MERGRDDDKVLGRERFAERAKQYEEEIARGVYKRRGPATVVPIESGVERGKLPELTPEQRLCLVLSHPKSTLGLEVSDLQSFHRGIDSLTPDERWGKQIQAVAEAFHRLVFCWEAYFKVSRGHEKSWDYLETQEKLALCQDAETIRAILERREPARVFRTHLDNSSYIFHGRAIHLSNGCFFGDDSERLTMTALFESQARIVLIESQLSSTWVSPFTLQEKALLRVTAALPSEVIEQNISDLEMRRSRNHAAVATVEMVSDLWNRIDELRKS